MLGIGSLSVLKWGLVGVGIIALAAFAVLLAVTRIELRQAQANATHLQLGVATSNADASVAVVYFSRSGNTAVAAQHVAQRLNARLLRIESPDYEPGMAGIARTLVDAREHDARITPLQADLSGIRTIYLGSPIWLYSPAPPIWAFAARHRFDGQDVVLFNTFNSKFEQRFIDDFRDLVLRQGARSFRHVFVKRGRMTQQITREALLDEIDAEWQLTSDTDFP